VAYIILSRSTCWTTVLITSNSNEFFFLEPFTLGSSKCALLKEDGGQGLLHLPTRHTTFCLQCIQKFLTGRVDGGRWLKLFYTQYGLGLDAVLFLMDAKPLQLAGVELFKVWGLLTDSPSYFYMNTHKLYCYNLRFVLIVI